MARLRETKILVLKAVFAFFLPILFLEGGTKNILLIDFDGSGSPGIRGVMYYLNRWGGQRFAELGCDEAIGLSLQLLDTASESTQQLKPSRISECSEYMGRRLVNC